MAETNIATAKVTVESSRTSGSVKTSDFGGNDSLRLLTEIRDALRNQTQVSEKESKMSLGGLGGMGALSRMLSGAGGAFAGGALTGLGIGSGLADRRKEQERIGFGDSRFFEAFVDGEQKVIEVNEKTGKIEDILTLQEAKYRQILDKTGQILPGLQAEKDLRDKIGSGLEMTLGIIDATTKQLEKSYSEAYKQELYDERITEAKRAYAEKMEKLAGITARDILSGGSGSLNYSPAPINQGAANFTDMINNYNRDANTLKFAEKILRSTKPFNIIPPNVGLFKR
jgi:hypothetical protein